ncbi:MAG: ATPase, T2SS/T4P/T4SS family [Candidatus Omnitrophota bacterium]|nr:ATPase, T2SS/T4P/T4SS family [Candidatus Omnitrophota bacterium]
MAGKKIGELLVIKKIITQAQLDEVLAEQLKSGGFLAEIIASKGFAEEDKAARALGEESGVAYIDLTDYSPDPGIVKQLPQDVAVKLAAVPLFKAASGITVAMADPQNTAAVEQLQKFLKSNIRPVFGSPSKIKKIIASEFGTAGGAAAKKTETAAEYYSNLKSAQAPGDDGDQAQGKGGEGESDSLKVASLAPVVNIVDSLVKQAVEIGASDIHLEPQADHFYCRYRIDGVMRDMPALPKKYEAGIISRVKIMSNMDIAEKRLPQDGRIQTTVNGKNIDLRISTFPTINGENLVLRILDRSRSVIRLTDLGMDEVTRTTFDQMIHRPHGIILITGPTGSGKTTTLYAVLSTINSVEKNILTMEDPVEYEIDRVRQSQVNVKAGVTFAAGLRSMLRQDPDVIMIGEIRDFETAEIAIHAALTGHLVFSTLHTNDAVSATTRLIDMGVEPFLISSSLICAVAQRLVRVLCPECKEAYEPPKELIEQLKMKFAPGIKFFREKGCPVCRQTGYTGRIGIYELFIPDEETKNLIDKKVTVGEIRAAAVAKGMKTMRDDALEKLSAGITSLSEILRATMEA